MHNTHAYAGETVLLMPFMWDCLYLSIFASLVAPFGGFFASGNYTCYTGALHTLSLSLTHSHNHTHTKCTFPSLRPWSRLSEASSPQINIHGTHTCALHTHIQDISFHNRVLGALGNCRCLGIRSLHTDTSTRSLRISWRLICSHLNQGL